MHKPSLEYFSYLRLPLLTEWPLSYLHQQNEKVDVLVVVVT